MKKLMIAAPKSGSGKTVLTCGLLEVFRRRLKTAAFKCGPDYIDPLFHKRVLGIGSVNLDPFFETEEGLLEVFQRNLPGREGLALIEGVMGYFDGLGGTSPLASSAQAAKALDCPVVLAVDARGASLSLAAVVKGFLEYRPKELAGGRPTQIQGVILNRVSERIYTGLRAALEAELGIRVLGYVPSLDFLHIESRHLGLILPEEIGDLREQIGRLADVLSETLDIDGLLEIAGAFGEEFPLSESAGAFEEEFPPAPVGLGPAKFPFRLGVARDEAFCFYYQENLRLMEVLGARLVPFSPIHDPKLPEELDGLLLGGGYPEFWAKELEENGSMRRSIFQAAKDGLPILGECGGFLYLLERLEGADGKEYQMAGLFSGTGRKGKRLGNFGYAELTAEEDTAFLKRGETIKAHEFHYWQAEEAGCQMTARKPAGGKTWPCMRETARTMAGFPHLYYRSCPEFAKRFAGACRSYQYSRREKGGVR